MVNRLGECFQLCSLSPYTITLGPSEDIPNNNYPTCFKSFDQVQLLYHLTLEFHSVNGAPDYLVIHSGFTLVLARREVPEEAHLVVVEGRHLLSAGEAPQNDVRVGVGCAAGYGNFRRFRSDNQVIRGLWNKWSLGI